MRRALWTISILLGIGLIAAVVCRRMCTCCEPEEEGEVEDLGEETEVEEAPAEDGMDQDEESIAKDDNSDPH